MSRSQPSENTPNPAVRWFEWNGEKGNLRYYDKEKKETVEVALPFTFILLDQLGTVGGWNEASKSGIYSNEVRDTRQDVLIVKSFKGGTIDEGLYKDIKDHVTSKAVGGQFVANCYIAFKLDKDLAIGSVKFKGAALGAWMEFGKANRAQLYKQAIVIEGFVEGKKGRIVFRVPTMKLKELSEASNNVAVALDAELQTFLTAYLKRTKREQADTAPTTEDEPADNTPYPEDDFPQDDRPDSDLPF